uniref:Endonuclease/exonuclease/phosphatase domain-containing protein n=1 Tax=Octopus bimaculoides TaxID=37653 RepID=A0A0L8I8Z6_OCTBM
MFTECFLGSMGREYYQNPFRRIFIYSSYELEHTRGVGIVMSARANGALIGWKHASDYIIIAQFQTELFRITVIQAYAPIEDAEGTDKVVFFDHLEESPHHDLVLLIGNFNAKIARNRQGYEHHMWIHKKTWRSPDGRTFNEVDYVCISKWGRSTLLDVRMCRRTDVGSDHYLLLAKSRLRLRCLPLVQSCSRPFAVGKFKDRRTVDQFRPLPDVDDVDIDSCFRKFQEAIIERAEKTSGRSVGS